MLRFREINSDIHKFDLFISPDVRTSTCRTILITSQTDPECKLNRTPEINAFDLWNRSQILIVKNTPKNYHILHSLTSYFDKYI